MYCQQNTPFSNGSFGELVLKQKTTQCLHYVCLLSLYTLYIYYIYVCDYMMFFRVKISFKKLSGVSSTSLLGAVQDFKPDLEECVRTSSFQQVHFEEL